MKNIKKDLKQRINKAKKGSQDKVRAFYNKHRTRILNAI